MAVTQDTRRRMTELSDRVRTARARVQTVEQAAEVARGQDDSELRQQAEAALQGARSNLDEASALQAGLLREVAGMTYNDMAGDGGGGRFGGSFLEDPTMQRTLESLAHSTAPVGNLALGQLLSAEDMVRRIQTRDWTGDGRMQAAIGDPIVVPAPARYTLPQGPVPQLRRRLSLLDLLPTQTMDGLGFSYTQEIGSFLGAVETAELAMKPPGDVSFTSAEVKAKTIAAWFKTARQVLSDLPNFYGLLTSRLMFLVMDRIERQILAGDGVGENIKGIYNTPGVTILEIADVGTDTGTDAILDGITAVINSDAHPTAVVVNPNDRAAALKRLGSTSGLRLDSDGAFSTPEGDTIWGLPCVTNRIVPAGTALVGDFTQGATLMVREGVNVRTSDSDQDDFLKNRLSVLAECRVDLAIWRPACFCVVDISGTDVVTLKAPVVKTKS